MIKVTDLENLGNVLIALDSLFSVDCPCCESFSETGQHHNECELFDLYEVYKKVSQ